METSVRILPNFKLIQALMYVIITCKYEKNQIKNSREKVETSFFTLQAYGDFFRLKNNREKVETPFFPSLPYLLPWKPVVGSGRISNSFKLSCMLSLPASMKRIRSRTAEKKLRHHFPIISLWDFLEVQWQLTPQSLVRSGRISNSSEMIWMFSLPASMKKIRLKMKALEC